MKRGVLIFLSILCLVAAWTVYRLWERTRNTGPTVEIEDVRVGTGPRIEAGQTVTLHYVARVRNGAVYSETRKHDMPFTFVVGAGQVLPGWELGLKGMRVGGLRRIIIPPELAYGPRGSGTAVPPDATLEVEIELLRVN